MLKELKDKLNNFALEVAGGYVEDESDEESMIRNKLELRSKMKAMKNKQNSNDL